MTSKSTGHVCRSEGVPRAGPERPCERPAYAITVSVDERVGNAGESPDAMCTTDRGVMLCLNSVS